MSDRNYRLASLAIVSVAAVAALIGLMDVAPPQYEPVGGALVPRAAAVLILVTAGAAAVREALSGGGRAGEATGAGTDFLRVLVFVAAIGLYTLLLSSRAVGFGLTTAVFVSVLYIIYQRPRPGRGAIAVALVFAVSLLLEMAFTRLFVIDLVRTF